VHKTELLSLHLAVCSALRARRAHCKRTRAHKRRSFLLFNCSPGPGSLQAGSQPCPKACALPSHCLLGGARDGVSGFLRLGTAVGLGIAACDASLLQLREHGEPRAYHNDKGEWSDIRLQLCACFTATALFPNTCTHTESHGNVVFYGGVHSTASYP